MMNRVASGGALLLSLFAIASTVACDKESSELGTSDIEADFTVDLDNRDPAKPETKVHAKLRESASSAVGPQGSVNLSDGDSLSVKTDKGEDTPMPRESDGNYDVKLPTSSATSFTFTLKRATASATSALTLPGALALTDSPADKTFKVDDTVHFAWSNPAKSRNLEPAKVILTATSYPCGGESVTLAPKDEISFDDTGSLDVTVARLYGTFTPKAGDCVNITVKRQVVLDADASFDKASSVTGTRSDKMQIKIQ